MEIKETLKNLTEEYRRLSLIKLRVKTNRNLEIKITVHKDILMGQVDRRRFWVAFLNMVKEELEKKGLK